MLFWKVSVSTVIDSVVVGSLITLIENESDGEGLLDDLQITLDRGETLEQFADHCLQHLQSNGGLDDPAAEPRKFES